MPKGRWKASANGPYFDPNDDGPNQVEPPVQPGGSEQVQPAAQPSGGELPEQPAGAKGQWSGGAGYTQDQIYGSIADTYSGAFGRTRDRIKPEEYGNWAHEVSPGVWDYTTPDWQTQIYNSPEAQRYRAGQTGSTHTETGPNGTPIASPTGGTGTTAGGYNLDQLRQALMSSGLPANAASLKQFIAQHPEFATGITIGGSKNNKLYYNGQFIADVIEGTDGPNPKWAWDTSTGGGGGGGGTSPTLETLIAQLHGDKPDSFSDSIHQTILSQLETARKPPSLDDPEIASQIAAFESAGNRALHQGQEAFAERQYATGGTAGTYDSALQGSYSNLGWDVGQFSANELKDKYKSNLDEIDRLLALGASVMSNDDRLALEQTRTAIQAELAHLGLDQDNAHFYDNLGFNIGSQEAQLNALLLQLSKG